MQGGTVLKINLRSLAHNYTYLRSKINPETKMLGVVKAFSYGSDAVVMAKKLESLGIDYLAVAYTEEGVALRENGIKTPILILHPLSHNFEKIIEYNLEPGLYSLRVLNLFLETAKKKRTTNFPIHLNYNSGLNRLGVTNNDIEDLKEKLENNAVKVVSIFSHLVASEDLNEKEFTDNQIFEFQQFASKCIDFLGYTPLLHQSNTSGILNYQNAHFSLVRTGIGLYGYGNEAKYDAALKPVASLTSVISQINVVEAGASVGYNRGFIAKQKIKSATIAIGHADGIGRIYGNGKGFVIIKGKKAHILGNVCMDMIMVNVTDIECKEGDEVIIFNDVHSANELAEAAGTISYELITGIGQRIVRVIEK